MPDMNFRANILLADVCIAIYLPVFFIMSKNIHHKLIWPLENGDLLERESRVWHCHKSCTSTTEEEGNGEKEKKAQNRWLLDCVSAAALLNYSYHRRYIDAFIELESVSLKNQKIQVTYWDTNIKETLFVVIENSRGIVCGGCAA